MWIFDNRSDDSTLITGLASKLEVSSGADFCVGYFNLRGWQALEEPLTSIFEEDEGKVRILVGMVNPPQQIIDAAVGDTGLLDNSERLDLRDQVVADFRRQLVLGSPSASVRDALLRLKNRIGEGSVEVRLFLAYPLHAKLYFCHYADTRHGRGSAFVGSSNLTASGLRRNGELNVAVADANALDKLHQWFEEHWQSPACLPLDSDIIDAIDSSWASDDLVDPYLVYLKMAYHLGEDVRAGIAETPVPQRIEDDLLDFQTRALKIAARHLERRGGVLLGDVVGLGKSMIGTALAALCEETLGLTTLIVCPKNLAAMWHSYVERYDLRAKVLPLSRVRLDLDDSFASYGLVMVDESHNLRNRDTTAHRTLTDYIRRVDAKCVLLSATPYNTSYHDLAAQLRLFIDDDTDLGIQPEALRRSINNERDFQIRVEGRPRSISAFEKSDHPEDWQELLRHFMVRRTRSFVKANYAEVDESGRSYLEFGDGTRNYFPDRVTRSERHRLSGHDDPARMLFSDEVLSAINGLALPRYSLGTYLVPAAETFADDRTIVSGLRQSQTNLVGLTRTSLFKRLESSGHSFIESIKRHRHRDAVFLHALENGLPLPRRAAHLIGDEDTAGPLDLEEAAADTYNRVKESESSRVEWISPNLFKADLREVLQSDIDRLGDVLGLIGEWQPDRDSKAAQLLNLLTTQYAGEKVAVFTGFADTARYLGRYLEANGIIDSAVVIGGDDPADVLRRFSPSTNQHGPPPATEDELRILVATDVVSEGQNLQDSSVVVQYDLPWGIIKLVQRAGRVDRIGQQSDQIEVVTIQPHVGVDGIIGLTQRLIDRLIENNEVVGSDDEFFGTVAAQIAGARTTPLDDRPLDQIESELDTDDSVDLGSWAMSIWTNATRDNEILASRVKALPDLVTAARSVSYDPLHPTGLLSYTRTTDGYDSLIWITDDGQVHTQSPMEILRRAACAPETVGSEVTGTHLDLVAKAREHILDTTRRSSSAGVVTGVRRRVLELIQINLQSFEEVEGADAVSQSLIQRPLRVSAERLLRTFLRERPSPPQLAERLVEMHDSDELCLPARSMEPTDVQVLCSIALSGDPEV